MGKFRLGFLGIFSLIILLEAKPFTSFSWPIPLLSEIKEAMVEMSNIFGTGEARTNVKKRAATDAVTGKLPADLANATALNGVKPPGGVPEVPKLPGVPGLPASDKKEEDPKKEEKEEKSS